MRPNPRVLICDDEPVLRALIHASLRHGDYDLVDATDGDEAVELALSDRPDLVLLDMMMPGRTGLQVLQHLRSDPDLAEVPVIMLTARAQEDDRQAAADGGATFFLPKPFSPAELACLVEEALGAAAA